MPDPLDRVIDAELKDQLRKIRALFGDSLPALDLQREVQGFQGQRGIYKPAGSDHALWVRQTLKGTYPDEEPTYHPDGSWTYRYSPEGRDGRPDLDLPTNRGLLRCQVDGIPVGVFRQTASKSGRAGYEVLGLAFVDRFDGTHFILRGEPINWTAAPQGDRLVPTFAPFELNPGPSEAVNRTLRDRRFGAVIRRIYHERCSLCSVGYRVRGKSLGLDAAHIIPVEEMGNIGDIRNGLLLCRNHHSLFDGFAWTMDEDLRVILTGDADFRRSAMANHVLSWEGKRLPNLPEMAEDLPAPEAIRWRLAEFEKL